MGKLPVGLQVYSVRDDAEKDFLGTMKKIKEIGYDFVELAGLYGQTAEEVKAALEEAQRKKDALAGVEPAVTPKQPRRSRAKKGEKSDE